MRLFYPVVGYSSFTEHPHGDMEESPDGMYVLHSEAQAEIERLRGLVREAYEEGVEQGYGSDLYDYDLNNRWLASAANKQLGDKP